MTVFARAPPWFLSLLFFLLCCCCVFAREKGIWDVLCVRGKKERKGVKALKSHQLPSFSFCYLSFHSLFSLLFFYTFAFPNVRFIMANGLAAHFLGFGQWHVSNLFYPFFVDFWLIFGCISTELLDFLEHDLTHFSRAISLRHLQLLFRQQFDMTNIRIAYASCGHKFNLRIRMSYALFHL